MAKRAADEKLLQQLRDTEPTVLAHLSKSPDDLRALALADFLAEAYPDSDPRTHAFAQDFQRARRKLGAAAYGERARALGIDAVFLRLWQGLRVADFGQAARAPLAERVCAITDSVATLEELHCQAQKDREMSLAVRCLAAMKKLDPHGVRGKIDASYLPGPLDEALTVEWHPSGHLRLLAFRRDDEHHGRLALEEKPGAGRFALTSERGGHGFAHDEHYHDGKLHMTFFSPWHDGVESAAEKPWAEWVRECIGSILQATAQKTQRARRGKRQAPKR